MKSNEVSGSSAVGHIKAHLRFKVKYCHNVFDDATVKNRCAELLYEAGERYGIGIEEMGFDRNHVHMITVSGPTYAICDIAHDLKGYTARKLLKEFPDVKKRCFWDSGLWNPAYWLDSVSEKSYDAVQSYVRNQGKPRDAFAVGQQSLMHYS